MMPVLGNESAGDMSHKPDMAFRCNERSNKNLKKTFIQLKLETQVNVPPVCETEANNSCSTDAVYEKLETFIANRPAFALLGNRQAMV